MIQGNFIIKSATEMQELGVKIASCLKAGDVLVLSGELGAGKTTLTQGIARGLGIKDNVNSPSFNIIKNYAASGIKLNHIDVYRLESLEEAVIAGVLDAINDESICILEWGENIQEILPDDSIHITIEYQDAETRRVII